MKTAIYMTFFFSLCLYSVWIAGSPIEPASKPTPAQIEQEEQERAELVSDVLTFVTALF